MPAPPTDQPADRAARNPARVLLDSPLAAASRARVYHQRTRQKPRERWLRVLAMVGALLVHLLFLFGFVLGPAYQPTLPPPSGPALLQVRLIEPPEPPPPPPVRGTPPRLRGPRHQGHVAAAPATSRRSTASTALPTIAVSTAPLVVPAVAARAPAPQIAAAPMPPVTPPPPAPAPPLQPVPLAAEPPAIALPTLPPAVPVPPTFQPEPVRKPQLEGNQPVRPAASLTLSELPPQALPPIAVPTIALNAPAPAARAPATVQPVRAEPPAAPPAPELQAVPLAAQPMPTVNLSTPPSAPAPSVPRALPRVQSPALTVAQAALEAVPQASVERAALQPPSVKIPRPAASLAPAVQTSLAPSPPAAASAKASPASAAPATPSAAEPASAAAPDSTSAPSANPAAPGAAVDQRDVSSAPDATAQGSDSASPGTPEGVVAAPVGEGQRDGSEPASHGQGHAVGNTDSSAGSGQPGGQQPGATQGAQHGALGSYVELKPQGDADIMNHGRANIGYRPTRFDQDWTPDGESSVDTALRHAVEKTTVSHTFHLPRGVRVECSLHPLLPIALFGCHNPDPPPAPVASKVYDRLHLAPANPVAPPTPASVAGAAAPIQLDNSAQCATARIAGGPPPPGCEGVTLPVKLGPRPASSSSSWVPASDQFH